MSGPHRCDPREDVSDRARSDSEDDVCTGQETRVNSSAPVATPNVQALCRRQIWAPLSAWWVMHVLLCRLRARGATACGACSGRVMCAAPVPFAMHLLADWSVSRTARAQVTG